MSGEAIKIDALQACRQEAHYHYHLAAPQLGRLAENDIELMDTVAVTCDFYRDDNYKPFVRLAVDGKVMLPCQRCFEPMEVPFSSEQDLVLLVSEHQDEQNFAPDSEPVWLDSGEWLNINQVVEDEILLSLPSAPLHAPEDCAVPLDDIDDIDDAWAADNDVAKDPDERPNPFAVLAQLKDSS